jgi:hypothetical protein
MPPFLIKKQETEILEDPSGWHARFAETPAFLFDNIIDPPLLDRLMQQSASACFVDDDVEHIGTREVESPQLVGGLISLLLSRPALLGWLEKATGLSPIKAVTGRLVQTRANDRDALAWHDDLSDNARLLAVVINLSDQPYDGGIFELRKVGTDAPFLTHQHQKSGSMMLFAVRPDLQHRVTKLLSGGPRRVYAGWFLSEPEHPGGLLGNAQLVR